MEREKCLPITDGGKLTHERVGRFACNADAMIGGRTGAPKRMADRVSATAS